MRLSYCAHCSRNVSASRPPGSALTKAEVPGSLLRPKRVLVGDGDPIVLALVSHILTRQGFATNPVADRDELLRLMKEGVFDAILVDAAIEGVLDAVAGAAAPRRAILTTTSDETWDRAYATLKKPLEFELLIETVRNCAEGQS